MRAAAQDFTTARLCGVRANRLARWRSRSQIRGYRRRVSDRVHIRESDERLRAGDRGVHRLGIADWATCEAR
jgi:hypothetical protein